jgi:hypothetical protein
MVGNITHQLNSIRVANDLGNPSLSASFVLIGTSCFNRNAVPASSPGLPRLAATLGYGIPK